MTKNNDDSLEGSYVVIKNEEILQYKPKYSPIQLRILNALYEKPMSQLMLVKKIKAKAIGNVSTACNALHEMGDIDIAKCEHCETTRLYSLSKTFLTRAKQIG